MNKWWQYVIVVIMMIFPLTAYFYGVLSLGEGILIMMEENRKEKLVMEE